jgi:intraflagellar transport protein 172
MVTGADKVVVFYDSDGKIQQKFDYSQTPDAYDFTVAEPSPSSQCVVLGSFNRLHVFNYSVSKAQWEEAQSKIIENFYTVTAMAWKPDGSRLVVVH